MSKKHRDRRPPPRLATEEPDPGEISPDSPALRRQCNAATAIVTFVMLLILTAVSTTHVLWPDDQYTDMNTLMSGENFATHGLFNLKMLPVFYIGAMTDPPSYYTHYPTLTNVMNGVLHIVGIESLVVMRIFCGLLCIVGLLCMYWAFAPDIGSLPAACGLGFVATTGFFFTYGISLHHTYNILFMGLFFLLFVRAVHSNDSAIGLWVGCWVVLMLESMTSFEFIIYPQVFAWVYVSAIGQLRKRWLTLLVLGLAPVAGVGLHLVQNCWAMGFSAAVADAVDAFHRPGRGPAQDRWAIMQRVPDFVRSHSQRLYYWPWTVLPVLAAVWLTIMGRRQAASANVRRAGMLLLAVLVSSVSWYLFMPIHTVKHPHTMSQLLPLTMIVLGGAIAVIIQWLFGRHAAVHERILAGLAAVVVIFGQTQTIAECFDRAGNQRPESFYLFEAMGDSALPAKVGVLTNTYADAQLAYFIRRPLWRCPTPTLPFNRESIAALQERLPDDWRIRYYIFDTRGDRQAFKVLAGTCPGRMLAIPGPRPSQALVIFDISNLLLGPEKAKPLKNEVREAQLQWRFPRWDSPGFAERLREVLIRHGKLKA